MNVLDSARELGLFDEGNADAAGGIAERVVLDALAAVSASHGADADLFAEAAVRVQLARSAGVERIGADSVFARQGHARDEQFRYRAEMREVFIDLAIDVASRERTRLEEALEAGLVSG
jgi:hypothetical protein